VDTPGLFEVRPESDEEKKKQETRTNEFILSAIQECLKNEITKINCVIIFITVSTGISAQDVESIDLFLRNFASPRLTACVCITRAETFSDEQQAAIREELRAYPRIANLIKEFNVKILFSGCIDTQTTSFVDAEQLEQSYRALYDLRAQILNTIFESKEDAKLVDLAIIKQSQSNYLQLCQASVAFLQSCVDTKRDFGLATYKAALDKHELRMLALEKAGDLLTRDQEIRPVWAKFFVLFKTASAMYSDDTALVQKFTHPFGVPV